MASMAEVEAIQDMYVQGFITDAMKRAETILRASFTSVERQLGAGSVGRRLKNGFICDGMAIGIRTSNALYQRKGDYYYWCLSIKEHPYQESPDYVMGFAYCDRTLQDIEHIWLLPKSELTSTTLFIKASDLEKWKRYELPLNVEHISTRMIREHAHQQEKVEEQATGGVPQVFDFEGQEFNTVLIEGEPWFDRNAICQILGIKESHRVMERLSPKGCHQVTVLTKGGMQKKTFIDEKNLYRLIGRSDKPQATKFMDWVYDEVLPSIRKTGSYSVPEVQVQQGVNALEERVRMMISLEQVEEKVHAFRILELEKLLTPGKEAAPA